MLQRFVLGCFLVLSLPVCADNKTLLILGDSLSAAYGIPINSSWVSLLQKRLDNAGYSYRVVNKSISGETTLGTKVRLQAILSGLTPDITVVELGGNDGLRGLPLEEIQDNLSEILDMLVQSGSKVLLLPMQLPPNYGAAYNQRFTAIYDQLAAGKDIHMGTFILSGIAGVSRYMQDDGIHPAEEAQGRMLENIWPELKPLL